MKFKGVRVDVAKSYVCQGTAARDRKKLLQDINKIAGFDVEIWAAASIAKAFDSVETTIRQDRKRCTKFYKKLSCHTSC